MTRVQKLEQEIQKLDQKELAAFRDWFRRYDSDEWDRQIEKDIAGGKLDTLAQDALKAHRSGKSRAL
jgi:hypothetical protein